MIKQQGNLVSLGEVYQLWYNSPVLGAKRNCNAPHDFGDVATVGKHLKRSGISFYELQENLDFGIYLGPHENRWIVGIFNENCTKLVNGEAFNSLNDLKQVWELD